MPSTRTEESPQTTTGAAQATAWAKQNSVTLGQIAHRVTSFTAPKAETKKNAEVPDQTAMLNKMPHLVLHLDINETILVGDEAGGDSITDAFHKMLAKSSFVQVPEKDRLPSLVNDYDAKGQQVRYEDTFDMEPTHWWNGQPICCNRQEYDEQQQQQQSDAEDASLLVPPLYTGWTWPPHCVPYYRTKLKRIRGKQFCHHYGALYQETFDQLRSKMPKNLDDDTDTGDDDDDNSSKHNNKLMFHLIPAFWETMIYLAALPPEQPWTLVFRTFGTDLPDLAEALTAFAKGRHPLYPNFKDERFVLDPTTHLFRGKWVLLDNDDEQEPKPTATTRTHSYKLHKHDDDNNNNDDNEVVASGDEAILQLLHQQTVCGIVDDYHFWDQHDCQPWSGKPVWKLPLRRDNGNGGNYHHHHVLFDDNIHNLLTDSIASVRAWNESKEMFETLSARQIASETENIQGIHLIRTPTVEPLLNPQWFVQQLQQAQRKFMMVVEQN